MQWKGVAVHQQSTARKWKEKFCRLKQNWSKLIAYQTLISSKVKFLYMAMAAWPHGLKPLLGKYCFSLMHIKTFYFYTLSHLWHKGALSLCGTMQHLQRREMGPLIIIFWLDLSLYVCLSLCLPNLFLYVQLTDRHFWDIFIKLSTLMCLHPSTNVIDLNASDPITFLDHFLWKLLYFGKSPCLTVGFLSVLFFRLNKFSISILNF